jgi:tetratricopeptide (TPR) repeat protein
MGGVCEISRIRPRAASVACYSQVLRVEPTNQTARARRGDGYFTMGDWRNALADYASAFGGEAPVSGLSLLSASAYALLLATGPDQALRNGTRAVELALGVCGTNGWQDAAPIAVLAAAYAETGDYTKALAFAKWRIEDGHSSSIFNLAMGPDELRAMVDAFEKGKPSRMETDPMRLPSRRVPPANPTQKRRIILPVR